ncbi:hypothetical protein FGO68_gene10312 [Halteria grandinella]|uniref:Uncharacterized protein n=1 Tax=Halteria grandinella TaxID=5974 RepID=A0A8J8T4J2_HALGN|nr:hypothetical protein FGO68_gene10312 [Halteria grandinella]
MLNFELDEFLTQFNEQIDQINKYQKIAKINFGKTTYETDHLNLDQYYFLVCFPTLCNCEHYLLLNQPNQRYRDILSVIYLYTQYLWKFLKSILEFSVHQQQ